MAFWNGGCFRTDRSSGMIFLSPALTAFNLLSNYTATEFGAEEIGGISFMTR
jgi:hypothetical protein